MRRENGGRGLKNMKDLYKETKVRVVCYMTHSESAWIKTAWSPGGALTKIIYGDLHPRKWKKKPNYQTILLITQKYHHL